ncbi:MAG TPA: N-acetyl-gamma-glutamyl-phosphate reductase [Gemmatimonadales bacterium]|nr:N-acetyl-gamma-glutamyl-phosphate reductase [Gemmatimonadales bacterium]
MRVAVIGAAGYAAGELLRILLQHPEVTEVIATSRSQAGKPLGSVHPSLATATDARFAGLEPGEAARGADVAFLALEHGESSKVADAVFDAGPGLIVDLAADFRTSDLSLYRRYYGEHQRPELVGRFTYALADVLGAELAGKRALAAPGCFATAAELALWPLAGAGLSPALFAVTGSSGSGVLPKPTTHHPARAHNVFAYSVLGHRHEAEVLQRWHEWNGSDKAEARLMTHSGPFVRGIYLTLHARIGGAGGGSTSDGPTLRRPDGHELVARYKERFEGRPFVRILDQPPELTHVVGTNYALIHAAASEDGRELQVMVAIDNLVKGAGGQAVQAMNLALGLPETAGLLTLAPFPC